MGHTATQRNRFARVKQDVSATWRLWLAMDIVTTKLDKSMGGTEG